MPRLEASRSQLSEGVVRCDLLDVPRFAGPRLVRPACGFARDQRRSPGLRHPPTCGPRVSRASENTTRAPRGDARADGRPSRGSSSSASDSRRDAHLYPKRAKAAAGRIDAASDGPCRSSGTSRHSPTVCRTVCKAHGRSSAGGSFHARNRESAPARRPVSRVLCRGSRRGDGHPSRPPVARRLVQPTRGLGSAPLPPANRGCALLFGLAPGRACRVSLRPRRAGIVTVALVLASRRTGVTRYPALWSSDFPHACRWPGRRATVRPPRWPAHCTGRSAATRPTTARHASAAHEHELAGPVGKCQRQPDAADRHGG